MRRIEEARKGYESGDLERSRRAHAPEAIREEVRAAQERHQQERGKYLSEAVYGASDGIVTTFAVVAGVTGAALSPVIVLVLGLANLLGDGVSMAAGAYLGERSQQDYHRRERERERWEVEHFPEGEVEEIREIYRAKGFEGEDLERAVRVITSDRERWVETMMREELQIIPETKDPLRAGLTTLVAFVVAGSIPLLAYILAGLFEPLAGRSFLAAVVLTSISMFAVGAARSLVIHKAWYQAGTEMLAVGGVAAAVAYLVGFLLRGIV